MFLLNKILFLFAVSNVHTELSKRALMCAAPMHDNSDDNIGLLRGELQYNINM